MDDRGSLTRLRALVYRADGPSLVTFSNEGPWPTDS